eukprot:gene350-374_t
MKKNPYQPLKNDRSKEVELDTFLSSQHGLMGNDHHDSKNDRRQSGHSENDDLEYSYRQQPSSSLSVSSSIAAHDSSITSLSSLSVMYEKLERRYYQLIIFVIILSIVFILYTVFFFLSNLSSEKSLETTSSSFTSFHAKSIAFGSCSSYDLRDLSIWDDAILPIQPDAWIWTGDFVYLDETARSCSIFEPSEDWQRSCNCSASWLAQPPSGCHAGDVEYASDRWEKALRSGPYLNFLNYMCPKAMQKGIFPPPGSNPELCDRALLGIYDDHDFGWNNGNMREPQKRIFKELFLDAIGENVDSPRRNAHRGAYETVTFNEGEGSQVDMFILDERYERDPLPCEARADYCEAVLSSSSSSTSWHHLAEKAWCEDFLHGGLHGRGSCCRTDEDIFFGWCRKADSKSHEYYRYACDPSFAGYGLLPLYYDTSSGQLRRPSSLDPVDVYQDSPLCEVLGSGQRRWLRDAVQRSRAPLQVFISGSVLLADPRGQPCSPSLPNSTCRCGGDNLDCYTAAQQEILYTISQSSGCAIVLTGDYHFSDIKVLQPGNTAATSYYPLKGEKPLYQVMSSGLSYSTAVNYTCADFRKDPLNLRTHPECSFVRGPNFGRLLLEVDHHTQKLTQFRLQVLSGLAANQVLLETVVDAKTCQIISSSPSATT